MLSTSLFHGLQGQERGFGNQVGMDLWSSSSRTQTHFGQRFSLMAQKLLYLAEHSKAEAPLGQVSWPVTGQDLVLYKNPTVAGRRNVVPSRALGQAHSPWRVQQGWDTTALQAKEVHYSWFCSSGARRRWCQVSEPKRHFFANIIGTSKQTKFLFHLHEQAPDQKKHLKFFSYKTNWKTQA